MAERRRSKRVRPGPIEIQLSRTCQGLIVDLGVFGALVRVAAAQEPDARVPFRLELEDGAMELGARVVRSTPDGAAHVVALEFEDLSMDEIVRLSQLVDSCSEEDSPSGPQPVALL